MAAMIRRRFVNIVAENYKSGVYSLHRLDVSKHLFYPSTLQAQEANTTGGGMMESLQELPAPSILFQPEVISAADSCSKTPFFGLVSPSSSEGRIYCGNGLGLSGLYDADADTHLLIPPLPHDMGRLPIVFSAAPTPDAEDTSPEVQDLFVLSRTALPGMGCGSCFLRLGGTFVEWQALPPPPFVNSHRYTACNPAIICSHAMVDGGRTICVSFLKGFGTYCFDTVELAWKQVGDWELPFKCGAEYAPDLNLWVGFSPESPHHLCWTSKLSTMVMDRPPELQHIWEDLVTPDNWWPTTVRLINLGSGRFCITKLFVTKRDSWDLFDNYDDLDVEGQIAVFTGIEIGRGAQGPNVLKHKSIIYQIMDDDIQWVL